MDEASEGWEEIERSFAYRPPWLRVLLTGGAGWALAVFAFQKARVNVNGLVLLRMLALPPAVATALYWGLFGVGLVVGVLCLGLALQRLFLRQRVAFAPAGVLLPESRWSSREQRIPYAEIQSVESVDAPGGMLIEITHPGGVARIVDLMLPSKKLLPEVLALLRARGEGGGSGQEAVWCPDQAQEVSGEGKSQKARAFGE